MNMDREIRRGLSKTLMHVALLAGSILFSAPFLWLASTSAKSPDELYPPEWRVRAPKRVIESPYMSLQENERPKRPMKVEPVDWDRLVDPILEGIQRRLIEMQHEVPAFFVPHLDAPSFSEVIFVRILRRAPDEIFSRKEPDAVSWFVQEIDVDLVQTAFDQAYHRVALGEVAFVGWDMTATAPIGPKEITWEIIEGDAKLIPRWEGLRRSAQEVHYRFGGTNHIVLQTVVPMGLEPDNLKKIRVSNHADRSWHTIWATVEFDGKRFSASEPAFLRNNRWQDTTWQFASEEDRSVMIKTWLVLRETGSSNFTTPGQLRLTLEYRQSAGLRAFYHKCVFNYREVLQRVPLFRYVRNSVVLVVLNIFGQLLGSSLVAFAFARLRWPGREFCFILLLATLMVPPQVTLIPVFLIFKELGWYNTLQPLWVPAFFGNAFFIFLLRQFMRGIPADLEDSAKIDGCGFFGIYFRIILPLIKPALAAIAIFTFMGVWNDFMGPLIFITDQALYPLSLGLFSLHSLMIITGQHELMMAAAVLMTIPVIILFFAAQRHFIQGITLTGLKG